MILHLWLSLIDCWHETQETTGKQGNTNTYTRKSRTLGKSSKASRHTIPRTLEQSCAVIVPNPSSNLAQSMLGENESQAICRFNGQKCYFALSNMATLSVVWRIWDFESVWMIDTVSTDAQKPQTALFHERLGGTAKLNNRVSDKNAISRWTFFLQYRTNLPEQTACKLWSC